MEEKAQKLRELGYEVKNGQNGKPFVNITKKVVDHPENKGKGLVEGLLGLDGEKVCSPACKEATAQGYELCIGGNCVFFPI